MFDLIMRDVHSANPGPFATLKWFHMKICLRSLAQLILPKFLHSYEGELNPEGKLRDGAGGLRNGPSLLIPSDTVDSPIQDRTFKKGGACQVQALLGWFSRRQHPLSLDPRGWVGREQGIWEFFS